MDLFAVFPFSSGTRCIDSTAIRLIINRDDCVDVCTYYYHCYYDCYYLAITFSVDEYRMLGDAEAVNRPDSFAGRKS